MSNTQWNQNGSRFYPNDSTHSQPKLPGGIYLFRAPPMSAPYFAMKGRSFDLPPKLYGNPQKIVNRVVSAYEKLGNNVGVHLDGLKGTGKTVTAKMVCNALASKGVPVLLVDHQLDLQGALDMADSSMVVFFDEFEKIYRKREEQETLLSALDGTKTNNGKHLFLFTTNDGFASSFLKDRPGRCRYKWNFDRLSPDVVYAIIEDRLENKELATDTASYLLDRETLTIDAAMSVVTEVNTFNEAPKEFEDFFALERREPLAYDVMTVHPDNDKNRLDIITTERGWRDGDLLDLVGGDSSSLDHDDVQVAYLSGNATLYYTYIENELGEVESIRGAIVRERTDYSSVTPAKPGEPTPSPMRVAEFVTVDGKQKVPFGNRRSIFNLIRQHPEDFPIIKVEEQKRDYSKHYSTWRDYRAL